MAASREGNLERDPLKVSHQVVRQLEKRSPAGYVPNIEEIQDIVEETLILMDFSKTTKNYILYRQKRAEVREKKLLIPEHVKN